MRLGASFSAERPKAVPQPPGTPEAPCGSGVPRRARSLALALASAAAAKTETAVQKAACGANEAAVVRRMAHAQPRVAVRPRAQPRAAGRPGSLAGLRLRPGPRLLTGPGSLAGPRVPSRLTSRSEEPHP